MASDALADVDLVGSGLRLRSFAMTDLPLIEEASSDDFIPLITTVPFRYTPDEGAAFIDRQLGRRLSGEGWSLAIHDETLDCAVGQIGLWLRNAHKGRAEIGYWVAPSGRGSGAAGRATDLLSHWAFANLDISRLSLFIEPWNLGSIRTAEAAGYDREGLLKSWERVDGVAKDMLSFVRLHRDVWPSLELRRVQSWEHATPDQQGSAPGRCRRGVRQALASRRRDLA